MFPVWADPCNVVGELECRATDLRDGMLLLAGHRRGRRILAKLGLAAIIALAITAWPSISRADPPVLIAPWCGDPSPVPGPLETTLQSFSAATVGWAANAITYTNVFALSLFALDMAWTSVELWLSRPQFDAFIGPFTMHFAGRLGAMALRVGAPTLIPALISYFTVGGAATSGATYSSGGPTAIFFGGLCVDNALVQTMADDSFLDLLKVVVPISVAIIFVTVAYVLLVAEDVLAQIEADIWGGLGVLLLAGLLSRWTRDIGLRPIGMLVGVGMQLATVAVFVGLGQTLSASWASTLGSHDGGLTVSIIEGIGVGGAALVFGVASLLVPMRAASAFGGGISMSAAQFVASAGQVVTTVTNVGGKVAPTTGGGGSPATRRARP